MTRRRTEQQLADDRFVRRMLRQTLPKRVSLGPRLFGRKTALNAYYGRLLLHAETSARRLLMDRPGIDDEGIAAELIAAGQLVPLVIGDPFSIDVECAPTPQADDHLFGRRYQASVKVPYSGSAALWTFQLSSDFDAELNGKAGETKIQIKDLIESGDTTPLKEYVEERLAEVRKQLHHHDFPIVMFNMKLKKSLRSWVVSHADRLAELRVERAPEKRLRKR